MIKRIITTGIVAILVLITGIQVFARRGKQITRDQVPSAVIKTFEQSYPKVTVKEYEQKTKRKRILYQIEYMDGTARYWVKYTADGKLVSTEEEVAPEDLPEAVSKAVASNFPGEKVLSAHKVTRKGAVRYALKLKTKKGKKVIRISENGEVIQKKKHQE